MTICLCGILHSPFYFVKNFFSKLYYRNSKGGGKEHGILVGLPEVIFWLYHSPAGST